MSRRVLIVNADDFGRSAGVNRGVIQAHESGIVTSATLMVRWPAAAAAAAYAASGTLSVGLHLDLSDWEYTGAEWRPRYEVLPELSLAAVEAEVARQLERFKRLVGRPPTHLDSHQHVHNQEPVLSALRAAGERLGVPVRSFAPAITYTGHFYGQSAKGFPVPEAITVEALIGIIQTLPPGVTELGCHPAAEHDHPTSYGAERMIELATLCDPRVRAALEREEVELRSFAEL